MLFLLSFLAPVFANPEPLIPLPAARKPLLQPTPPSITVYGYHAYWTGSVLDVDLSPLSHIAVFNVDLNSDGTLSDTQRWTSVAEELITKAHNMNVKVHLCLTSFSDSINNVVLPDPNKRATLVNELATLVNDYGADGVNIDIEGMDASQRENLNLLVTELQPHVDEIYLATPAIDWSDAYDYAFLANNSDGLFIMGYGYHWKRGDPGPVDPLYGGSPWSAYSLEWTVEDYRSKGVPDDKIVLGLPLYGRQWPTASSAVPGTATGDGVAKVMGEAISYAQSYGSMFDAVTHTPYVLETNQQLWYCDIDSIEARVSWAVDEDLQGIGFWALDYELGVEGFWEMIQEQTVLSPPEEPSAEPSTEPGAEPSNEPTEEPVADAGEDIYTDLATITLDGNGSVSNGTPIYLWSQKHGPSATISLSDQPIAEIQLSAEGTYVFELNVRDEIGDDDDTVMVVYQAATKSGCSHLPYTPLYLGLLGFFTFIRRRTA